MKSDINRIIQILQQILQVEDVEIKNYAIEALIDMLEDMEMHETSDGKRS